MKIKNRFISSGLFLSVVVCLRAVRRCKGMARISLGKLYRGEGTGGRYNIMGKVVKELLINGVPPKYDEDTWREILLIKHTDSDRKNEKRGRLCVGVNRYKSRPFFMRRDNLKKIKNIFFFDRFRQNIQPKFVIL